MTAKDRDKLMDMMKAAGTKRMVEELMAKTKSVHIRITESDKRAMEEMAEACGLTLTEYILRLHKVAQEGLLSLKRRGGK